MLYLNKLQKIDPALYEKLNDLRLKKQISPDYINGLWRHLWTNKGLRQERQVLPVRKNKGKIEAEPINQPIELDFKVKAFAKLLLATPTVAWPKLPEFLTDYPIDFWPFLRDVQTDYTKSSDWNAL